MILKSSQTHTQTHSHKQSFPFVSSYCFFWSTVKTANHDKKRRNTKERSETRRTLREGSGSQLWVSITVSHHSDWWPTVFATLRTNRQGDKHQSSTRPRPSARHFPLSSWLFIFLPSQTSATLLPVFQLLYSHQVTYSDGGEMVYKCTLMCDGGGGGVIYTARWSQTDAATSWRWEPAPCWRWTGLLHLLREVGGGER